MPDIDYTAKSDRDLLIEVVVTTNGMSQKLDKFCDKVEVLEAEHTVPAISKKTIAASAGAGGGIVGILIIIIQVLLDYISKANP